MGVPEKRRGRLVLCAFSFVLFFSRDPLFPPSPLPYGTFGSLQAADAPILALSVKRGGRNFVSRVRCAVSLSVLRRMHLCEGDLVSLTLLLRDCCLLPVLVGSLRF